MNRKIAYSFFAFICMICLPIILLPARIYTHAMLFYQIVVFISLLYMMCVVLKAALRKRKGAWINFIALLIFIIAVTNDILYYNNVINTGDMVGFGLFTFIFAQTLVLASRFSMAFSQVAQLSYKLGESNRNLERNVKERTLELEELNAVLRHNVSIDGLTNIRNRRFFDETIQRKWEESLIKHTPISLILADIDYFKFFNDYYGHQAGDECLKQVAQEFEKTINKNGFVTRYGGEEFAIILPNTSIEEARSIGEKLRLNIELLELPNEKSKVSNFVTVSIGIATTLPRDAEGIHGFINAADNALYNSKSSGRNVVRYEITD